MSDRSICITYGTFDLLHEGHLNILKRAKALSSRLIVGVTSDSYDRFRGKLNVHQSLVERIENVKNTGLADQIIVEEYEGQKIDDIKRYGVQTFVIGSDWVGKFDYLQNFCKVVYLERTPNISSTISRADLLGVLRLGVIGTGRIAHRFIAESKFVSGVNVVSTFNPRISSARNFANQHDIGHFTDNLAELSDEVDAVYIASPHSSHHDYIHWSLNAGLHVLCEKPLITPEYGSPKSLFESASKSNLVLMEAIKTAFCPGFRNLINLCQQGVIGQIVSIDSNFTRIITGASREFNVGNGSILEYASYCLLPAVKLLGPAPNKVECFKLRNLETDIFTQGSLYYDESICTIRVGTGVKTEGHLIVSGTRGYIYVPAPWWKTSYFEVRRESGLGDEKYYYPFHGDGLRYELQEFYELISGRETSLSLSNEESCGLQDILNHLYESP